MIIYISGKYSGDIDNNIALARRVAIEVWERGHVALCPHLNTANFEKDCKLEYDDYIKGDLLLIEGCQAILMLPGWEESQGAQIELEYAEKLGLPVYYYPDIPDVGSETVLEEAQRLVYGARQKNYGHPRDDFDCAIKIFNAYVKKKYDLTVPFDATDVPMFMIAVKMSREANKHKRDNLVDMCGYVATLERIHGK
jgi:hypothetical protein